MYGHLLTIQIKFSNKVELEKKINRRMREMINTCFFWLFNSDFANIFFWFVRKWWRFLWMDEQILSIFMESKFTP